MNAVVSTSSPRPKVRSEPSGYLFILPAAVLITTFSFVAIGVSFWISLRRWDVLGGLSQYIGLANYRRALFDADSLFRLALANTTWYVVMVVPTTLAASLILALMARRLRRASALVKTIYFIPSITPTVIISLVWFQLYDAFRLLTRQWVQHGWIGQEINLLGSAATAMPALALMAVWQSSGYNMVIFLAGLAEVPQEFYDAAAVDGATRWRQFWHITIPLLRNTLIFVSVMLIIGAFQVFTSVYIMTQGGPAGATEVMASLIFHNAFEATGQTGYACALAWLMFAVVFVFVLIQMRLFRSRRIYD
ncbi:MAG: carbohydrate ABC transporter permease [Phycisphaerae bacterium]